MKRFHIAFNTHNIEVTVEEYSERLGMAPVLVIEDEYALWRTPTLNVSVRKNLALAPGEFRHVGWEDPEASAMTADTDSNNILWEHFSAEQQAEEINSIWPDSTYKVKAA